MDCCLFTLARRFRSLDQESCARVSCKILPFASHITIVEGDKGTPEAGRSTGRTCQGGRGQNSGTRRVESPARLSRCLEVLCLVDANGQSLCPLAANDQLGPPGEYQRRKKERHYTEYLAGCTPLVEEGSYTLIFVCMRLCLSV